MTTKKLPGFKNEEEFAKFVETHDMGPYLKGMKALDEVLILAPTLAERIRERSRKRLISLRLPNWQIEGAKEIARKKKQHYQTLIQIWIGEGLRAEMRSIRPAHH
ncbi:MAG: BrnA antitoxin family protein [Elusimicrobia bacterium]|nr:BrnA antitoxin family protein [Elusimicrobiota bacterium]